MEILIALTDPEIAALQSEQQPSENLTDVMRRLISPLVERAVKQHFAILAARFETVSVARQAQIIAQLEKLFVG